MSGTSSPHQTELDYRAWMMGLNVVKPRLLHSMMRVKDFDAALRFYVDGLGMRVLDRVEVEARNATALFVGFDVNEGSLELVRYRDSDTSYTHGSGYGHIAIGVPDVLSALAKLEVMGVEVTTRPTKLMPDAPLVAFVKDPDGYSVELVQAREG